MHTDAFIHLQKIYLMIKHYQPHTLLWILLLACSSCVLAGTPVSAFTGAGYDYTFAVNSFSPAAAQVGETVTIAGAGFTGVHTVAFGCVAAAFEVVSDTIITAVVPAGLTEPVKIVVKKWRFARESETLFTPLEAPADTLAITSFAPLAFVPGDTVTVYGTLLSTVQHVSFRGLNASFTILTDTSLMAVVPDGLIEAGLIRVSDGTTTVTSAAFVVLAAEPTVPAANLDVAPAFTVARFVWKKGDGARHLLVIKRADNPLDFFPEDGVIYSPSSVTDNVDSATGNYIVYGDRDNAVRISGLEMETAYVARVFEYNGGDGRQNYLTSTYEEIIFSTLAPFAPVIDRVDPACATPGTTVTLEGRNLEETSEVVLNGASIAFTVISDNALQLVIPTDATNGSFGVTVETILYMSADFQAFQVLPEEPTVPATGLVLSSITASSVTIQWTNGDGDRHLVMMKEAATAFTFTPEDCDHYIPEAVFGQGLDLAGCYVVFGGGEDHVTVTGLTAGTTYEVYVYEYNKLDGGVQNYLTTSVLTGAFTTSGTAGSSARMAIATPSDEVSSSNEVLLQVAPNPSYGQFEVRGLPASTEPVVVRIVDTLGRLLYEQTAEGENVAVHLPASARGTYVLQLVYPGSLQARLITVY